MKTVRFVCSFSVLVFAVLMMVLAAAQTNPVSRANQLARANQASALPETQTLPARAPAQPAPAVQVPPAKFAKAVTYSSGGYEPDSVAIGDLNGDGVPDLAVVNRCGGDPHCTLGSVSVLLGNGDGTFRAAVTYNSGGYYADSVAIADVNGDGKPDLVVANLCPNKGCGQGSTGLVSVLLGNGDGTFQPPVGYSSGGQYASAVAVGDLNGDGTPDIAVANFDQCNGCSTGGVSVLLGNGDGTFQAPVSYSSGGYDGVSVAIGDVNGDGHPDLVVGNDITSSVGVLLGNGDGTFQAAVTYSLGGNYVPNSIAVGDLRGDGILDLVTTNNVAPGISVLLGNGDGTFQAPVSYNPGVYRPSSVAITDVNGDGHPDLVVAGGADASVLLGNGDGTFQTHQIYRSGGSAADSVAVGDLNGDGRPDLVVANLGTNSVGVLLNLTQLPSTTQVTSSPNPSQVNQSVTFTATITSTRPIADGELVTFYNGATKLGTGTTTKGAASLTTSFATAGKYTIKASYPGDAFHKASSGKVRQVVQP